MAGPNVRAKPSLKDAENITSSLSSQSFLKAQSPPAGDLPDNQASEVTSSGLSALKPMKNGEKSSSARFVGLSSENSASGEVQGDPSAESSVVTGVQFKFPKPKLDLRRKRQRQLNRKRRERKCRKIHIKRTLAKISREERIKQYKRKGFKFSFVKNIYGTRIPCRMRYLYEHAALKGFFKYIKLLKCEHHLKKALVNLNVGEELEKESLETRRHKYLDDDGPLSPIEETNEDDENDNSGEENIGARIVENSCFILSRKIPGNKSKRKTKVRKM